MAATIKIDADTRDARRQIGHIDDELLGLVNSMRTTGRAAQGLNATRFTALATGISAAGTAFQMVGAATDFARNAIQQYFESSAEGRAIWEQIDMQFKSALGTIGELILGTSDVAEAGELVRDVMGDVTAVIRGVGSVMEPLISVMRTGLLGVLGAVATMFGKAKDEADEYAVATARVAAELRELDRMTSTYDQTLVEAVQGTDDYQVKLNKLEEIAGLAADQILSLVDAEYGLVQQGQITERQLQTSASTIDVVEAAYADLRRQIIDAIVAGEDLDRGFGSVAEEANALGSAIAQVQIGNLADELERLNIVVASQSLPFFDVFGQVVSDLQEIIEGDTEAQEENNAARRNGVDLLSQQTDAILELTKAQQRAKVEAREQVEAQRAFYEELYQQGLERGQAARREFEEQQRAQAEAERQAERERLAEATRMAELMLAQKQKQAEAERQAMEMRKGYIDSAMRGIQGLIQAEGSVLSRARKVMGAELVARGQSALMQAGIAFAQLNIPKGAALTAAGSAAIALGKRFGARGGGMGAGRGRGASRSATVTQNITFAGAAGQDQRSIARSIERASRDGVLQGLGAT